MWGGVEVRDPHRGSIYEGSGSCRAGCLPARSCCWHSRVCFGPDLPWEQQSSNALGILCLYDSLSNLASKGYLKKKIKKKEGNVSKYQSQHLHVKTQQPWSPWPERVKGAGREGTCTDEHLGSGFYLGKLAQPCAKCAGDLWEGSACSFPEHCTGDVQWQEEGWEQ